MGWGGDEQQQEQVNPYAQYYSPYQQYVGGAEQMLSTGQTSDVPQVNSPGFIPQSGGGNEQYIPGAQQLLAYYQRQQANASPQYTWS